MPSFQFAATPIVSPLPSYESGQEITFQVEISGPNPSPATVHMTCAGFAQNPAIVMFETSTKAGVRTQKVKVKINASAGAQQVTLTGPLGGTLGTRTTATFTVAAKVTVKFGTPLIDSKVAPDYEVGEEVTLCVEATGANKYPATVDIYCDAFNRNPVGIMIPAAPRMGSTAPRKIKSKIPVKLKGPAGTYAVEMRDQDNCTVGVAGSLKLVDPVKVWFETPALMGGLTDLKGEQDVKLQLRIDRTPKRDFSISIRCPGFGKSSVRKKSFNPFVFEVKKGADPANSLQETITLVKADGKYSAELAFPDGCLIGAPNEFTFEIGPKRAEAWLSDEPFAGVNKSTVVKDQVLPLQVHFTTPLEADVQLTVKGTGLEPASHSFKIPKGSTSPFTTKRTFKLIGEPGLYRIELEATDTVLKNPIDIRHDNQRGGSSVYQLPWPPGTPGLEFADDPFVKPLNGADTFSPGETVRFLMKLDREVKDIAVPTQDPNRPSVKKRAFLLRSEAFTLQTIGNHPPARMVATILEQGTDPANFAPVEATLREDIDFGTEDVKKFTVAVLAQPTTFTVGAKADIEIGIRNYAVASFPAKLPVKPVIPEGHDIGTQITFRVELSEKAARGGAEAVLRSPLFATSANTPTGDIPVHWEEGRTIAMVDARILSSQVDKVLGGEYEVELVGPVKKCRLSPDPAKLKTRIKIRPMPVVWFRDAWILPAPNPQTPYRVGQFVTFQFELDRPAPAIGAQFVLTSALFKEPVPCEFVAGEKLLKVRTPLQVASPTGTLVDVEITTPDPLVGCVASGTPTDVKDSLQVLPAPNVKFGATWITPSGVSEYAEGTDVQIAVELDGPAFDDAYARISSTAFGGKSYVVQFPKDSSTQGAIVQTGKEDHPEKLLKPLLRSRRGRMLVGMTGSPFLLDKEVTPLEKTVTVNLRVGYADPLTRATKVQKITVTPIRGCGGSAVQDIYVKPNLQRKIQNPIAPCPFGDPPVEPPKYCNIHRLLIRQLHGGKPAVRGHDGAGTFEIVVSDSAPKRHRGAVVTPMRIQMIAGKVFYSIDDKPFHSTNIEIMADRRDYFCTDLFPHLDRQERLHPHVTVLQKKPYRLEALMAGGASIAQSLKMEKIELPEYPGWVAINPELGTTSTLMKWKKIKKQEDIPQKAQGGRVLWDVKLAKRRQGFDKMLTKGVAALIGKDELIFSDDDEALAEAANLGVDTSDVIGGIGLGMLIKSIMTIWVPRLEQYQVILESCGNPDPGKPTPKISAPRLVAMIEIYPSDEFCLFCNVTPVPAMQFGNDGQYMDIKGIKDNEAANKTDLNDDMPGITGAKTGLEDALRPISDIQVGPLSGSQVTTPMMQPLTMIDTASTTRPSENYANDEISGTRNTVGQLQSHGGGQVHDVPEFGGVDPTPSSQRMAQLSIKPQFTFLTSGGDAFTLQRKDALATEPRYPAPTPNTRVFHQVYEMDLFGVGGATGDITRDWNIAKVGLVVNGNPKPQFSPAAAAIYGLLYVIRHWSDIWRALQEMVPSWGWGVTFDLGFLEGGLRIRWGWKEYEDWRVFRWWQMEINCNLFRIMVELWAGFRARALFIKFEFVAFLRIAGILGVKASIERTGPSPGDMEGEMQLTDHKNDTKKVSWNADLSATTTAEVGLRMVLLHDGFLKATGSIKTGYMFKFKFKEPIEGTVGLTLEGYFLGVSVKLIVQSVGLKKFIQAEKVLIEGTPEGRPHFRRILFPKGSHGQKTPWKVKDQLELIWQKVSAQVARLDEALNDWYKIQLDLVMRRKKDEFERLGGTNPRADWPWTEDPGVAIHITPTGYAMKSTEDSQWRQQWVICKEALIAGRVTPVWDVIESGKLTKYKKSKLLALPVIGKKLHQKLQPSENIAMDIMKGVEKAEVGIEKVKNAIATINIKFVSTLRAIDEELERFADEDLKVSEEVLELIDEAKDWALWGVSSEKLGIDTRGTVRGIVEDALEDFEIEKLAKLVYQVDSWHVGGQTTQPKLFAERVPVSAQPDQLTLWIRGRATTIDMQDASKSKPNQPVLFPNRLSGLRDAINAMGVDVIASTEKDGNSYYLVLTPARPNMGNLAVTDGPVGELITGRK